MSLDLYAELPKVKLGEIECYCTPYNIGDVSEWSRNGAIHLGNITHNLCDMAHHVKVTDELSLYDLLWHSEEHFAGNLDELRPLWIKGFEIAKQKPELKKYNSSNGYGTYEGFIGFLERVIANSEPLVGIGVKCESDR